MKRLSMVVGVCAFALAAAPAAAAAPTSGDADVGAFIVGGEEAEPTDWMVQLIATKGESSRWGCSGVAISDRWVLTAGHCVLSFPKPSIDVHYAHSTSELGEPVRADKIKLHRDGDIALIRLSEPRPLAAYPKLSSSAPRIGDTGRIYGFGKTSADIRAEFLKTATVDVIGHDTDFFREPGISISGVTGASMSGDSGGPLLVDDAIVGVCSRALSTADGRDATSDSVYADTTVVTGWIDRVTRDNP